MNKQKSILASATESYEPTIITLDYGELKQCMIEAIQEALMNERKRRERAIIYYVIGLIVFGILLAGSAINPPRFGTNIPAVLAVAGLGITHFLFFLWGLTRYF